jgi:hypothetical protein
LKSNIVFDDGLDKPPTKDRGQNSRVASAQNLKRLQKMNQMGPPVTQNQNPPPTDQPPQPYPVLSPSKTTVNPIKPTPTPSTPQPPQPPNPPTPFQKPKTDESYLTSHKFRQDAESLLGEEIVSNFLKGNMSNKAAQDRFKASVTQRLLNRNPDLADQRRQKLLGLIKKDGEVL